MSSGHRSPTVDQFPAEVDLRHLGMVTSLVREAPACLRVVECLEQGLEVSLDGTWEPAMP